MNNYILLKWEYGRESMKMVVDKMEENCNLLLKKRAGGWFEYNQDNGEFNEIRNIMRIISDENNNVINWGNHIFADDNYFVVNKPSSIQNASNKSDGRRILRLNNIKIPKTFFWGEIIRFPVIARPSHHHSGLEFYIINNNRELMELHKKFDMSNWYFSQIFEKTNEYRVHCASGKVTVVQEKPLVDGEIRANRAVNHESWTILKWGDFIPEICKESLKATEVLGLDFSAVDIMWNENNKECAICEVNTSPSINTEYMSGKYAKYFDWLVRNNFPSHFDIGNDDFVFTNELLES